MPKRTDITTILLIGSGPIVIGQACEPRFYLQILLCKRKELDFT